MKLDTFFEERDAPSRKKLADFLKVPASNVTRWIKGTSPVPAQHCAKIEEFTKGKVRMEELRPDFPWKATKKVIANRIASL